MKQSLIVFVLLSILSVNGDTTFIHECYFNNGTIKYRCIFDGILLARANCLNSYQAKNVVVKEIKYECEHGISKLVLDLVKLNAFPSLNVMDISDLGIERWSFGYGAINFWSLYTLKAAFNHFKEIPSDILYDMPTINRIDFSYNDITRLKSDDFKRNIRISKLNFNHNNINIIEDGVFWTLQSLEELDISFNPISVIGDHVFVNNSKMKWLNLKNTDIIQFDFNIFSDSAKTVKVLFPSKDIRKLDISCQRAICHFEDFDKDDFFLEITTLNAQRNQNGLKALRKLGGKLSFLDLSTTSIGVIGVNMLQRFNYLQNLILNNANISSIESGAFYNQKYLKFLDLSYNKLANIDSSIYFSDHLSSLNVNGNRLTTIDTINPKNFPTLKSFTFIQNQFACEYVKGVIKMWENRIGRYNGSDGPNMFHGIDCIAEHEKTTARLRTTTMANILPTVTLINRKTTTEKAVTKSTISTSSSTTQKTTMMNTTTQKSTTTTSTTFSQASTSSQALLLIIVSLVAIIVVLISIVFSILCIRRKQNVQYEHAVPFETSEMSDLEPVYEEIMDRDLDAPNPYAVGNIKECPHYANLPKSFTIERNQYSNNWKSSAIYHQYATVYK